MKFFNIDKPVSEENGGSPPKPALVWMTEHQRDCSVGLHEAGAVIGSNVPVFGADTDVIGISVLISICRHCRCLFVEKSSNDGRVAFEIKTETSEVVVTTELNSRGDSVLVSTRAEKAGRLSGIVAHDPRKDG